jgi:hypothetical protein
MTWIAVAVGGSALIGAGASYVGSKKQADASKAAGGLNMDMFNTLNQQQQPFVQSGYGAMGKLNTLLGLSPNPNAPRMSAPLTAPDNPGYRITPGGGVDQMMQMGPQPQQPNVFAGGPGGDPRSGGGGTMQLRQILALRAQHGDTQAARMLGLV